MLEELGHDGDRLRGWTAGVGRLRREPGAAGGARPAGCPASTGSSCAVASAPTRPGEATFILIVTAHDEPYALKAVLDAGADDYVARPSSPQSVRARIEIAERRLQQTGALRAAEADLSRARWLAGIGETALAMEREISGPLHAILEQSERLLEDAAFSDDQRDQLRIISEQGARLAGVIGRAVNLESPQTVEYLGGARMIDLSGEHRAPDPALLRRLREEARRARDDGRVSVSALAAALLLVGASSAAGQSAIYGAGLQAWLGCWLADLSAARGDAAPSIVCITPTANVDVADLTTVQEGRVVARETLDATGRPRAIDAARCTGVRSARWSSDRRRLFVRSTGTCAGVPSSTSGLLAIGANGEWLDVEGISAGGGTSVHVARYREFLPPPVLPIAARSALRAQALATRSVRVAAGAPVRAEDVLEAARALDAAVVEAWILERAQHMDITEIDIAALVNIGVPRRIADALRAVAYPQSYADAGAVQDAAGSAQMESYYDESYALPLGWGWGWGYVIPVGSRFGRGFRDARRFGYHRRLPIVRGHDGRLRGRGERGQGHGGSPRAAPAAADERPACADRRFSGAQTGAGANRPPAGDPRYASPSRPAGGTVRLGRP